jgi:hypothetical protein
MKAVRNTPSLSTALRLSGPSCSDVYRDPDVPFDEDNGNNFSEALEQVRSGGASNFANALVHAVSDFIGRGDAAASQAKNLYIFVGGRDTCSSRPASVITQALCDLRAKQHVQLNLKFVGCEGLSGGEGDP